MKYRASIYSDVKEYFEENYGEKISQEQIDAMPRKDVLDYYLQWNGIFGYTHDIIGILLGED